MHRGIFRGTLDAEQRAVFFHIFHGRTGREIAAELGVTPSRIENIVRKTCRQLDAANRREAAQIVASHHCWIRDAIGMAQTGPISVNKRRNGGDSDFGAVKTAQTEGEHSVRSSYVRDVGSRVWESDATVGAYDKMAGRVGISKVLAASTNMQRLMVVALLVASCALALGALISAMLGFEVLMVSRFS